jgi:hypothetical protein
MEGSVALFKLVWHKVAARGEYEKSRGKREDKTG